MRSLLLLFSLLPFLSFSQYDSIYVKRYPGRLGIALYQSKPSYNISITNDTTTGGVFNELDYRTMANYITGIGLHYDKLSFFGGFRTPGEINTRKGSTKSSQFNLAFTGMKLRIEGSLRFYTGFYDDNSRLYIPSFSDSTDFWQNSKMKTSSWKAKVIYFLNKKSRFSYGAAYINNMRQMKSAGSFLLSGNLYKFNLKNDGPIVPYYVDSLFMPYQEMDNLKSIGLSAGIGYTHTFSIFKRLYLNFLISVGVENQSLNIYHDGQVLFAKRRTIVSAYDLRSSLGYNSNRFYISIQNIVDGNIYKIKNLTIDNSFLITNFILGYRFGVKIPVIDRFENR